MGITRKRMPMTILAPAKLNLFLNITGRREDGYHLLDSLFVFCGLADRVTLEPDDRISLSLCGPFAEGLESGADNIAIRAAELLRREASLTAGVRIILEKHIPVAAGLGGGSADAAAVLRGLNAFWNIGWPMERLQRLGAQLGADVPACLPGKPVIARGVGDELSPAPGMPVCGILLVNPRVTVPTPAVFKAFKAMNPVIAPQVFAPLPEHFTSVGAMSEIIRRRGNDLLPAAVSVAPAVDDVLKVLRQLPGVACAGLSGSGATCFAVFDTPASAHHAEVPTAWWRWSGALSP
jgi:4-diphosphocytidyl-2-C-methyl-D-erythritol kinase